MSGWILYYEKRGERLKKKKVARQDKDCARFMS